VDGVDKGKRKRKNKKFLKENRWKKLWEKRGVV